MANKDNREEKPVEMGASRHRAMVGVEKPKDRRGTLKRLLTYLNEQKIKLALVCVSSFVSALVFIWATGMNGTIIDKFIAEKDLSGLAKGCILLAFIYFLSSALDYIMNRLMVDVAQRTTAGLRRELFDKVSNLSLAEIEGGSSGDLMSRMTNDIDNINNVLSQSTTQLFYGIFSVSGIFCAMLLLSPTLTLIALTIIPIMFLVTTNVAKISRKYYKKQQKALGELNGFVEEMISSEKLIKLNSKEDDVKQNFAEINLRLKKAGTIAQAVSGIGPIMNMINNSGYLIVAVAGAYMIVNDMGITVGVMFSFLLYMKQFARPLNEIANLFNTVQSALAGAERVFFVLDKDDETKYDEKEELGEINGNVEFKNVSFSYEKGREIIKKLDIKAKAGEQIAIVGHTGAGKTTIISMLNRFYDLDNGEILIDGKNIALYSRDSLRDKVSMVLQDNYLFADTVLENIRYARPSATREEVVEAAKLARADNFINHLHDGYDTILEDNGQDLSQGQRQLISIARAILKESDILILDEATSSVDTATEILVSEAIKILMKGKTSFIIAHRLSTIKNADQILVMENGEIIESGNHNELMAKKASYYELVQNQYKIEE